MKSKLSIREFINSQKDSVEFKPGKNFVINLEKRIFNEINILNSKSQVRNSKVDEYSVTLPKRFSYTQILKPQLAYAFSFILVISFVLGGFVFLINRNNPQIPTQVTQKDPNERAREILARVTENLREIKSSDQVVKYNIIQRNYVIGTENFNPVFCARVIDYSNKIQRNQCGRVIGDIMIPIKQEILKDGNILQNPEFSIEFYQNNFNVGFANSNSENEEERFAKIKLKTLLRNEFKSGELKYYESALNEVFENQIITLTINKENNTIESAKIEYESSKGNNYIAYEYFIEKYELTTLSQNTFDEPKFLESGLGLSDIQTKILEDKKSIEFSFTAKQNINYLIISSNYYFPRVIANITDVSESKEYKFTSFDEGIIILPYTTQNDYFIYGDSIQFFRAGPTIANGNQNEIIKRAVPANTISTFLNFEEIRITKDTILNKLYSDRVFENELVKFTVPSGWKIIEAKCDDSDCNTIEIMKGNYSVSFVKGNNSTGSTNYASNCFNATTKSETNINQKFKRNNYIFSPKFSTNSQCNLEYNNQMQDYWYLSEIVSQKPGIKFKDYKIVTDRERFGMNLSELENTFMITSSYKYEDRNDYERRIQPPLSTDPDHLKILEEMDNIVRRMEFKD